MFDVDELISECQAAVGESEPHRAVREVLERTMADADAVGEALEPQRGSAQVLYSAPDITVIHFVWAPHMNLFPHDHRMWAAIGLYTGQEDNTFYRRDPDQPRTVQSSGGKEVRAGDVVVLGKDVIHSVINPLDRLTAAIHVYLGDYLNQPRSAWGPGPLEERPFDFDAVRAEFEEANTKAGLA